MSMFTGIVEQLGAVASIRTIECGVSLAVNPGEWAHHPAPGDSISVNGCCLTVTEATSAKPAMLRFDVVAQTLAVTTLGGLAEGDRVNLEHAVTPATLLGGHIVQGHVDGVGTVDSVADREQDRRIRIALPTEVPREHVVPKGSIAIDGVSLTIAELGDDWLEVALIPTTIERTTLGSRAAGDRVNLEADYVVKTVVNWQRVTAERGSS